MVLIQQCDCWWNYPFTDKMSSALSTCCLVLQQWYSSRGGEKCGTVMSSLRQSDCDKNIDAPTSQRAKDKQICDLPAAKRLTFRRLAWDVYAQKQERLNASCFATKSESITVFTIVVFKKKCSWLMISHQWRALKIIPQMVGDNDCNLINEVFDLSHKLCILMISLGPSAWW